MDSQNYEKMEFSTINKISLEENNTWVNKVFLTFDIDWANDDVLNNTIDLVENMDVAATWYVTNNTPVLSRLRANPKFELGIHPNFNWLLQGDKRNGADAKEVVERMMDIVPEAKSVRSHSMTQSSILLDIFQKVGLTHDTNHFIPGSLGLDLMPWRLWNGLIRVPYIWEDDIFYLGFKETINLQEGFREFQSTRRRLNVFDFHPIHVFLNTETNSRYEHTRSIQQKPESLINHVNHGIGTRNILVDLCSNWTK